MKLICVGKLKKSYYLDAFNHYFKQLRNISLIEIKKSNLDKEGLLILDKIKNKDYVISLDRKGDFFDSYSFSKELENLLIKNNNIVFIVGGPLGLSKEVLKRSNKIISFSKMTFPHELFRVMLIEQIYRAFSLIKSKKYHK